MNESNRTVATTKTTLGGRIADARKERGLTQDELAKKLGIIRNTLTYWETDAREPRAFDIAEIAKHLSITCDYLLLGIEPNNVTVSRELGLSNTAIESLKKLVPLHNNKNAPVPQSNEKNTVQFIKLSVSHIDCINNLLEEPNWRVIEHMRHFFAADVEENKFYRFDKNSIPIRGSDIYASRLLAVQLALTKLKETLGK